jgi:hypothetical protein
MVLVKKNIHTKDNNSISCAAVEAEGYKYLCWIYIYAININPA